MWAVIKISISNFCGDVHRLSPQQASKQTCKNCELNSFWREHTCKTQKYRYFVNDVIVWAAGVSCHNAITSLSSCVYFLKSSKWSVHLLRRNRNLCKKLVQSLTYWYAVRWARFKISISNFCGDVHRLPPQQLSRRKHNNCERNRLCRNYAKKEHI